MATQSSLQDCYFYFYSSCTKGDECPFRHCELALGTETVCSLWREGRCFRSNCKFRHMESRINRTAIPCYWENQPGGCRKPHCVFLHRKLRNGVQDVKVAPGLILPTSDGKTSPKHMDTSDTCPVPNKVSLAEKVDESDIPPDPSLTPVPPLVLSFDEGEESDTESVSSTPVKQGDKKAEKTRNNLSVRASGGSEEKDFGIKTLEQIRMEKIHKESDSYYGAAYASTPLDASRLIDQHYPPTSEFLTLPKDSLLDKSSPAPIVEPKLSGVDEETDLRGRLSNRRNAPSNKVNPAKRLINFKKQNGSQVEGVSKLDFRIKTLEEIRKEKESKQSRPEVAADSSSDGLPLLEEKNLVNNTKVKTLRKLKINRKSKAVSPVLQQDATATNLTENNTPADSASNVMKNLSPKSSENSSEVPMLNKNSSNSSPGKRKINDDSCTTASKVIKFATASSDGYERINRVNASSDKAGENHLQRPEVQPSPATEANNTSSHVHTPTSSSSVPAVEVNGVATSSSPSHVSSSQNVCPSRDETLNSSVITNNVASAGKDNLVDRSMSVDAELEELLGDDDMTIDEMDSVPNDDILLQIEEFLES